MDTIILILHVLLLSSKSTCENILDVSGIAESTYDFDEEIDIQNTYNNVYEEALKLEKQNTILLLKYELLKKKKTHFHLMWS